MEISLHDNFILSYCVDAQNREIRLQTAYLDGDAHEHTEVIFAGVQAYHFECDNFQNILFDITETDIADIYAQHQELFERLRNYGWSSAEFASPTALLAAMQERNIRGWMLESSFGLCGWVWAEKMIKCAQSPTPL